jgi:hypothetical protein
LVVIGMGVRDSSVSVRCLLELARIDQCIHAALEASHTAGRGVERHHQVGELGQVLPCVPAPFVAQFLSEDVMTRSTRRILLGLAFAATTASVAVPLLAQRGGAMTEDPRCR